MAVTILHMTAELYNGIPLVFATHEVPDPENWGVIQEGHSEGYIAEKPSNASSPGIAWGLIGFTKHAGRGLFEGLQKKGEWSALPKYSLVPLISFKDITRTR